MTNKKVTIMVDIAAQADNLNKIIDQSKKSLGTLQLDPKTLKGFETSLNKIQSSATNLKNNLATGLDSPAGFAKATKNVNGLYQQYQDFVSKVQGMGIDPSKIFPKTEQVEGLLKQISKKTQEQSEVMGRKLGKGISDGLNKEMKAAAQKGDVAGIKQLEKKAKAELTKENRGVIAKAGHLGTKYGTNAEGASAAIEKRLIEARALRAQNESAYKAKYKDTPITSMEKDLSEAKKYDTYKQKQAKITGASQDYQKQTSEIQQLTKAITDLQTKLQSLAGPAQAQAKAGLEQIANSSDKVEHETNEMNAAIEKSAQSFQKQSAVRNQLTQLKSYFGYMLSATAIVMKFSQAFRNAVNDIKALDKQLNEISIVTGKTMNELWSNFGKLNSAAQKYGVTTGDVVSVQKLYYQQGRSVIEVNQLTGETLTFAKISGLEFGDATEYMTAAINAYGLKASEANVITDTYAKLASEAAVSAQELAVAMSKVASLAAASNSDLQDTSAYLTKIIETTREAPETAGTALKTVIARFTAVNKLTEDQKELLDEGYNFNNIEKALKTIGISVKDSTGQMRGFSEIINELGPMWDSLTSNQQHYIATQAAGARQQSRFIALMSNWERTQELMGEAADSAGTGAKQLELSMDSIESKTNQLKATWQSFYGSVTNSELVKFFVDLANAILGAVNGLMDMGLWSLAVIPVIGTLLTGIIKTALNFGKAFGQAFSTAFALEKEKNDAIQEAKDLKDAYEQGFKQGFAHERGRRDAIKASRVANKVTDVGTAASTGSSSFLSSLGMSTAGTGAVKVGAGLGAKLGKVFASIGKILVKVFPYALIAAAIAAAIYGGIRAFKALADADNKKAAEKVKKAQEDSEEATKTLTDTHKKYTKALELQRKGMVRTEAETEEYQKALQDLQVEFPFMVKATKDGMLELVEGSETMMKNALAQTSQELAQSQKDIIFNSRKAFAMGVYSTDEANDVNSKIKDTFAILSEKTDDQLNTLGGIGGKAKAENLNKLAESGLSYEAMSETLNWGENQFFNADTYDKIVKEFANLTNETKITVDLSESDIFNSVGGKTVVSLLNALNQQAGTNVIDQLVEANSMTSILKQQVGDILEIQQGLTGEDTPDIVEEAISNLAVEKLEEKIGTEEFIGKFKLKRTKKLVDDTLTGIESSIQSGPDDTWENYHKPAFTSIKDFQDKLYTAAEEGRITSGELNQLLLAQSVPNSTLEKADISREDYVDYEGTFSTHANTGTYRVNISNLNEELNNLDETITDEIKKAYEKNLEDYYSSDYSGMRKEVNQYGTRFETMSYSALEGYLDDYEKLVGSDDEAMDKFADDIIHQMLESEKEERDNLIKDLGEIANIDKALDERLKDLSSNALESITERAKEMGAKYGKEAVTGFMKAYLDYSKQIGNNAELLSGLSQVDFFDTESIAKHGAQILTTLKDSKEAYGGFVSLVNQSSSILDRDFKNIDQVLDSGLSSIESMEDSMEILNKSIDKGMDTGDMKTILSQFGGLVNISDFKVGEDGFTLELEKANELKQNMLKMTTEQYKIEAQIANLQVKKLEEQVGEKIEGFNREKFYESAKTNDDYYRNVMAQAEEHGLTETLSRILQQENAIDGYINLVNLMNKMDFEYENKLKELKESIDNLKTIIDILQKLNLYADIDELIGSLERDLEKHDFVLEFSTNADAIVESAKDKMATLSELVNANMVKASEARQSTAKQKENLSAQWGQYVSFDDRGNAILNEEEITNRANEIAKYDTTTDQGKDRAEREQQRLDLMLEQVDAYKEEFKLIDECDRAAEKYTKEIEDFNNELREAQIELEDTFRDLFVKRDEEALDALEKRYDAMKKADEDYIKSVKDAIEEERRLRDQDKAYDDVAKMERQLELLRMSGGSATQIQALEQQISDTRQNLADTEMDNKLADIEKETTLRAEGMDNEVAHQQLVLETKKQNQIAYNAEIAALMEQDKNTILETWKTLDSEFASSTAQNKQKLEDEMEAMVAKGLASSQLLATGEGAYIPTIKEAYEKVKESIGQNTKAMENFSKKITDAGNQNGEVIKSLGNIKSKYGGIADSLKTLIEKQRDYNDELAKTVAYESGSGEKITRKDLGSNYEGIEQGGKGGHTPPPTSKTSGIGATLATWGYNVFNKDDLEAGATDRGSITYGDKTYYVTAFAGQTGGANLPQEVLDSFNGRTIGVYHDTARNTVSLFVNRGGKYYQVSNSSNEGVGSTDGYDALVKKIMTDLGITGANVGWAKYATGGMVNYTGPAWVDGTPSKPEAFLSANDTQLIAGLRDVLRANPSFSKVTPTLQKSGDTYYEIHINVDELGDGYSVDDLMDEMENRIVQATGKNAVIKIN